MDDKFKEILAGLPEKRQRSRLAPYGDFIDELRRRGLTYREIVQILAEKCQLNVASSTVIRFVHARSQANRKLPKIRTAQGAAPAEVSTSVTNGTKMDETETRQVRPSTDEIQQRIAALKLRPAQAQTSSKPFRYDPSEPLRLPPKAVKNRSGE
jgi:hypothetical protein